MLRSIVYWWILKYRNWPIVRAGLLRGIYFHRGLIKVIANYWQLSDFIYLRSVLRSLLPVLTLARLIWLLSTGVSSGEDIVTSEVEIARESGFNLIATIAAFAVDRNGLLVAAVPISQADRTRIQTNRDFFLGSCLQMCLHCDWKDGCYETLKVTAGK